MLRTLVAVAAAAACVAQPATPPPLMVFWNPDAQDNAVVATAASIASLSSNWTFYATDQSVISNSSATPPLPGTIPLNFYANPTSKHHMTTASATGNAWALANGFVLQRVEGWVYPAGASDLPMEMWYSTARGDMFLIGTPDNRANAIAAGYQLLYVDCSVPVQWVTWPSAPPAGPLPWPQSNDITGFEYAYGRTAVPPGIGADTWYPSWSANGNMYSSWTDGTVNGVGSSSADGPGHNATTGYATIIGDDPFNLTITDAAIYSEPAAPYQGRYPSLNWIHRNETTGTDVWYYGTYSLTNYPGPPYPGPDCGNWCVLGPFTSIRTSTDYGATWSDPYRYMGNGTDNLFHETSDNDTKVKMGAPHAVDFGQNNAWAPDDRLYMIGTSAETPQSYESWMQGDSVRLARTVAAPAPDTINDPESWQFWTGTGWSAAGDLPSSAPLFVWPNRTGVTTLSWHPSLQKFIMVISTPTTSPYTIYHFDTYFLESDAMTGPWALITYLPSFGPQCYFVHWPSKWMGNVSSAAGAPAASLRAVTEAIPDGPIVPGLAGEGEAAARARTVPVTQPLTAEEVAARADATGGYYSAYLSYSANFASGYQPNPPGSGYHWSLLQSRLTLSASYMERLAAKKAKQGEQAKAPAP